MTQTLTVKLNPQTEHRLRQLASEEGATLETVVERLLDDISLELEAGGAAPHNQLSQAQLADLQRRVKNPGPIASAERVAAVLAKFKV